MADKSYKEMKKKETYEERLNYLRTNSTVSSETFGSYRSINQMFYKSDLWNRTRKKIIIRDDACDMGLKNLPIKGQVIVHHINPITLDDIINNSSSLYDENNLVCVSLDTHNSIHYSKSNKQKISVERKKNDTKLW